MIFLIQYTLYERDFFFFFIKKYSYIAATDFLTVCCIQEGNGLVVGENCITGPWKTDATASINVMLPEGTCTNERAQLQCLQPC